jgi:hypothetical protein
MARADQVWLLPLMLETRLDGDGCQLNPPGMAPILFAASHYLLAALQK